ncbi:16S rRNA (adenine(1518)-N(6)/adenine(1519)-N(6))-dimethyltransferase RsmA [Entomospira culicis]|uniref:Ribosomal RNA small subunit methyltransferase A n=1 Tax=Entomospira culicis TaxID=2719989 RepID=A0A968KVL8_9SPIO|nr:16S rRNA (adenine(1518)-N(6)/adenine(1519)-N(6))-dimethyltransferase RsmA [Entomospira culicis]NIZ19048.1 ribosomal RNA small subunit methyltransferase A [Entomospira culicis]NIZ69263.1 ribosomal RNA small subunit methyltransferase A [Entomospira culicis]WDI37846.1 16S rRNA (adenine(1518)-N(6)/adenine(1519)-N(6))-dimethyltransferase RsmA [Entomospira culicis]WDI39474.1 16S rRNA (adenine(1518)-N(6)/adenine(1519)-N(6))-dimethyltransferase RsmA [Entomospira culicis]
MNAPLNYDSPQEIAQFLDSFGIAARKRWGQNFLINRGAREKLIDLLCLSPNDHLLEIGPGLGAMTYQAMTHQLAGVTLFEIDPAYQKILREFFSRHPHFQVIDGDVLQTWQPFIAQNNKEISYKILGNLPYNISSAIIQLLAHTPFSIAVLTVQKELAQRLMASPKSKNYSSLSVWSQCNFSIQHHVNLKAGSFYPQPNVDSAIISLTPRQPLQPQLLAILDHLLKSAFAHRRKILRHNWQNLLQGVMLALPQEEFDAILRDQNISYHMRAEEIDSETYLSIAKAIAISLEEKNHHESN